MGWVVGVVLLSSASRNKLFSVFPDREAELTSWHPTSGFPVTDTADLVSWLL